MRTFHHVGFVTEEQKEGAFYNEGLSVWLTDISASPNKIEFLKFEAGSWFARVSPETIAYGLYSTQSGRGFDSV